MSEANSGSRGAPGFGKPVPSRRSWRERALAAIRAGRCPEHETRLYPQPQGGWCPLCGRAGAWYSIDGGDTVVATYPDVTA